MMKNVGKLVVVGAFVLAAVPVMAVPVYFTDRASFDAATGGGLSFESFEADFAVDGTITFGDFTVSETSGSNALGQGRDFPGLIDGAITHGTGALIYDDNGSSIATFFSFDFPITAFGIDIATNEDSTVSIGGGNNISDSIDLTAEVASFWGVIDVAGLSSITFDASGGPNVGFDAASYGVANAPVPEPATLTLLGLGIAGLAARKRKRA